MNNELYHWGVLGQKWGRRRYQNKDGSLTTLGREHYGVGAPRELSIPRSIEEETADLRSQAEYLRARNNYIQEQIIYKKLMTPRRQSAEKFFKSAMSKIGDKTLNALVDTGSKVAQKQAEDWLTSKGLMGRTKKDINITDTYVRDDSTGMMVLKSSVEKRIDRI